MPKFVIEYHDVVRDIILDEAAAIEGAETLSELVDKLSDKTDKYDYAIVYILDDDEGTSTVEVDLKEFGGFGNGEGGQNN